MKGEKLKHGSISGLYYREMLLIRGKLISGTAVFACVSMLGILVMGSFEYGNLRLLEDGLKNAVHAGMTNFMIFIPLIAGLIVFSCAGNAIRDDMFCWRLFRKASPLSPYRAAFAKSAADLTVIAVCAALTSAAVTVFCHIDGKTVSADERDICICLLAVCVIFSEIYRLMIMAFHSSDKAGIAIAAVMIVTVAPVLYINLGMDNTNTAENPQLNDDNFTRITEMCSNAVPAILFVFAAVIIGTFFLTVMLMKRRER